MMIFSPETCNIARGRSPRDILPGEGVQIVILPSLGATIVLLHRLLFDKFLPG